MVDLTADHLKYFHEFQRVTGIHPFDCIDAEPCFVFLVENKGELFKAIGKQRVTLKKLTTVFRKPVFVYLASDDLETQIKKIFHSLSGVDVKISERSDGKKRVVLVVLETERGYAVGRGGTKIKGVKELLLRKFNVVDFQLRTTKEFRNQSDLDTGSTN